MSAANEIFTGIATLKDWLGNGMSPVTQEKADQRAASCLSGNGGKECPKLRGPKWWEEQTKNPIADAIKAQLEAKHQMKIKTALDEHPRMCAACGCCASLKVWTPINYIASHTPENKVNSWPAWCWMRIEIENL